MKNDIPSSSASAFTRRDFLKMSSQAGMFVSASSLFTRPVMAGPFEADPNNPYLRLIPADKKLHPDWVKSLFERGKKEVYTSDAALNHMGMPVGGLFTGTLYLSGDGRLWHWDIFNAESLGIGKGEFEFEGRKRPSYQGASFAYPLEPAPQFEQRFMIRSGGSEVALDRTGFKEVSFRGEYPRAGVTFKNAALPVSAQLEAFSPFIPLDEDDSGLPLTMMEYRIKNEGSSALDIEVVGSLQNTICHHSQPIQSGIIRNKTVQSEGYIAVECSAESFNKNPAKATGREDILFEKFDATAVDRWVAEGSAFEDGMLTSKKTGQVNTYRAPKVEEGQRVDRFAGLKQTGTLTSQPFKIERRYISAQVFGDCNYLGSGLCVVVDGEKVAAMTGPANNKAIPTSVDVSQFEGKMAHIEIYDHASVREPHLRQQGGIGVEQITFTDMPAAELVTLESLADHGTMTLALLGSGKIDRATALRGKAERVAEAQLKDALIGEVGRSVRLAPGEEQVFTFAVSWYFPNYRNVHLKNEVIGRFYASRFSSSTEVTRYFTENMDRLTSQTRMWADNWYDSSLPYWFLDRTMANTSTLATSTSLRFKDGRFWGWEGETCCSGTCTHVWQYAQAVARLFPKLEAESRDKYDFGIGQRPENGGINHRVNTGPGLEADDGQLGRILSVYREHQMTTDESFLKGIWPRVKRGMDFIIVQDKDQDGILEGPQRNTLDGEWNGKISWISSLYIAGLRACEAMANEVGDSAYAMHCKKLADSGSEKIKELFDGEYFIQDVDPTLKSASSDKGCLIDQVFGQSWAYWVGLGPIFDREMQLSALRSLYRYNFVPDMGPFRAEFKQGRIYALAGDAGLLMCTWPKSPLRRQNGMLYFYEFMTGFEWQVASHMIYEGLDNPDLLEHGLAVSRAIHDRYSAEMRNPYNEIECGNHYARAMASYGAYQSMCGYQYHGPKGELSFSPRLRPEDFRAAFTVAEGWGSFAQKVVNGRLSSEIDLRYGALELKQLSLGQVKGTNARGVTVMVDGKFVGAKLSVDGHHYVTSFDTPVRLSAGQRLEIALK